MPRGLSNLRATAHSAPLHGASATELPIALDVQPELPPVHCGAVLPDKEPLERLEPVGEEGGSTDRSALLLLCVRF